MTMTNVDNKASCASAQNFHIASRKGDNDNNNLLGEMYVLFSRNYKARGASGEKYKARIAIFFYTSRHK
jgi:hypothetical protein